jgi:hypothetical protein
MEQAVEMARQAELQAAAKLPPPATESEKSDAGKAYIACLHKAARRMDDGKSDAMSVALAIKPICAAEFRTLLKLHVQGAPYLDVDARKRVEDSMEPRQLEWGTTAVLDERKRQSH